MSAVRTAIAAVLLGFVLAATTAAQGLGDTAARERAKRDAKQQAKAEPAKAFTNEDLAEGRPPGQKADDEAPQATQETSEDQAPPPPTEDKAASERPLLDALSRAQQGITTAQTKVQQLSEKLNPMSVSYIYGAGGSNDANEELRVRQELREAESQLQAARQAVATANRNLQDFRQGRPIGSDEER